MTMTSVSKEELSALLGLRASGASTVAITTPAERFLSHRMIRFRAASWHGTVRLRGYSALQARGSALQVPAVCLCKLAE